MSKANRRAFLHDLARFGGSIAGLGLLARCTAPPPTIRPERTYRVGMLASDVFGSVRSPRFWERMAELGYREGQNIVREDRFASDPAQFPSLAAELVGVPVDVIVVGLGAAQPAAVAATDSIPIVFLGGTGDPVALGWAESLARPGRNVTGVLGARPDVDLKRLQLLAEAVPGMTRLAVLPDLTGNTAPEASWRSTAASSGLDLVILPIESADDFDAAFERAVAEGANGMLVRAFPINSRNIGAIVALLRRHRIPAISEYPVFVQSGGLMQYTAREADISRRAAEYVDRILRGEKPADMPIELPRRYELTVNMSTARALGLVFPASFLAQVDDVIE